MRKLVFGAALLAVLSVSENLNAQSSQISTEKGFYVDVRGGYNFPIATQNVGYFGFDTWERGIVNYDRNESGFDKVDDMLISLGKGANIGANIGYMFTKNIGAELGVNYLFGSDYTSVQKRTYGNNFTVNQSLSARMLQLSPTFVLRANYNQVNPYAKVGLLLGVGSKVTYKETGTSSAEKSEIKQELNGGAAVGVTGAAGLDYVINDKLSLFGEVRTNGLTYSPKKGKVVSYVSNGQEIVDKLPIDAREVVFSDSYTEAGNDSPKNASRLALPFSSVGINVGMKFKF